MKFDIDSVMTPEQKDEYYSLKSDTGKRLFLQNIFKNNFLSFVYLLGYKDIGKFHLKEIDTLGSIRVIDGVPVKRLWLWSRGFFKTSLITEAHTVWLIVNNPNIRVLITSYTIEVAKTMIKNIKEHFMTNQDFRYFFREYCPKQNKDGKIEFGTTEKFTIPNRSRVLKEPTVMCAGVGTNLTGLHFDYIKPDDLVNKDSCTNDTQIQSSKDYFSSLRQLFDNPSIPRFDVVGTIYHFNDLHSDLRKNIEYDKSVVPVHDENGVFLFPERIDEKGFDKIVNDASMNPYDIQSQYLLNPINPKEAKFRSEWWNTYHLLPEGCSEYICVDPASTQKKKSDYTVIERWGIDYSGKHYFIEGIRDKVNSYQRIDKLFEIAKRCKSLRFVKYEVLGGRHGDLEVIKERQIKEQFFFLVKETKSTNASKRDRIEQRLVPPFNSGTIHFPTNSFYKSEYDGKVHDFISEYKLEFLQFPFSEHDDILDCHAQMFEEQIARGDKVNVKIEKKPMTYNDLERYYDEIDRESKLNPWASKEQIMNKLKSKKLRQLIYS